MEKMRTHLILDHLKRRKRCTFAELMRKFGVSSATIHRDVDELARRDAVTKVRGGLVFNEEARVSPAPSAYQERVVANRAAKVAAARKALSRITDGDIVFLDSSTTVYELAMLLRERRLTHLTIVTNSLAIMQNFRKFPTDCVLIGLGGNYDPQLNSILGEAAIRQLAQLNVTKAFFSAFGLDDRNATTNHERQAELIRRVMDAAEKNYLIADRSKLKRTGLYRIAPRSTFSEIFLA